MYLSREAKQVSSERVITESRKAITNLENEIREASKNGRFFVQYNCYVELNESFLTEITNAGYTIDMIAEPTKDKNVALFSYLVKW